MKNDTTSDTGVSAPPGRGLLRHLPLVVILGVAAVGALTLRDYLDFDLLRQHRTALMALKHQHFAAMAAGFVGIYVLIVAFSLPGAAVASVAGGFLFGQIAGTGFNVIAATTGAAAIFLAARWGLGSTLSARFDAAGGRVARLRDGLRDNEVSVLLVMRLVPAVPFFLANLLPAMVGVGFGRFVWTTALGIVPGAFVFTSVGVGLGGVFDRGEDPDLSLLRDPMVIGPLLGLAVLAALPMLWRRLRARG
jgi:uncharacterized membrane protein YdjX (TVP38/TMEM64 family)